MKKTLLISITLVAIISSNTLSAQVKKLNRQQFCERIIDVDTSEEEEEYNVVRLSVVLFYGSYCNYARQTLANFNNLSAKYSDIDFYYIDIEQEKALAYEFEIEYIPTTIIFNIKPFDYQYLEGFTSRYVWDKVLQAFDEGAGYQYKYGYRDHIFYATKEWDNQATY